MDQSKLSELNEFYKQGVRGIDCFIAQSVMGNFNPKPEREDDYYGHTNCLVHLCWCYHYKGGCVM